MEKVEWLMKGRYLKNCNCVASCPCDTVGIPSPNKGCEGVVGMIDGRVRRWRATLRGPKR